MAVRSFAFEAGKAVVLRPASAGALKGASLTAGVVDGRSTTTAVLAANDLTAIYVGASIPTPVKGLAVGLAYDLFHLKGAGNDTWDAAVYVSYQVMPKLTLNMRGEYVDFAPVGVSAALAGRDFLSSTLTADYALWANVITRLEYRWDHDIGGSPKGPGTYRNANLLALNVIYKF